MVQNKDAEFQKYFGVRDLFKDRILSELTGQYRISVIDFARWLESQGYIEEDGTTLDFITARYGKEACDFIRGLI